MIQCLKYLRTSAHFITATCLHLSQNPQREICVGTYRGSMLEVPSHVSAFHHGNLLAPIAKSAKGRFALELTVIQCLKYIRTSAHFITATCSCIYRKIRKGRCALELTVVQCLKYLRTSAHFIAATCSAPIAKSAKEICAGTYRDSMLEVHSYVSAFHHGNLLAPIAKSAKGDLRWNLP